jgi:hypothetical protein
MLKGRQLGCAKGEFRQALLVLRSHRESDGRQQGHEEMRFFLQGGWQPKFREQRRRGAANARVKVCERHEKLTTSQRNNGHYYMPCN